ncbi:MAG: hypothetical protein AAAB14_15610, partial [Ensifer adhaerens]
RAMAAPTRPAGIPYIALKYIYFPQQRRTGIGGAISQVQKACAKTSDSTSPLHLSQRSNENARHRNCIVTDLKQFDPSKAA